MFFVFFVLGDKIAAKEVVDLLLIDKVALEVSLTRVSLFGDKNLHELGPLYHLSKVVYFFFHCGMTLLLSCQKSCFFKLFCLLLLNLSHFELTKHFVRSDLFAFSSFLFAHHLHLPLLFHPQCFVHLKQLALMLFEKGINIGLIHIFKDFFLLFS